MSEHRLSDYLDHMEQAATDARSFAAGLSKMTFLPTSAHNKPSS